MAGWTVVPNPDTSAWKVVQQPGPARPGVPSAPLPDGLQGPATGGPVTSGNYLQNAVDNAAAPDSASVRAKQTPLENGLSALGKSFTRGTLQPLVHPWDTVVAPLQHFEHPENWAMPRTPGLIDSTVQDYRNNGAAVGTGDLLGTGAALLTSGALGDLTAKAIRPLTNKIGEGMKSSAGRIVDQTAGLRSGDVSHGSQPGRAYLEGGGRPALTMRSLANKAGKIASDTGAQLGQHYADATAAGVKIPALKVAETLNGPISKAVEIQEGPGGLGNIGPLEDYSESFRPMLRQAAQEGGISPTDLFNAKKNVSANTIWNDPAQFKLNKVRQMNAGAMSGLLGDVVPEVRPLNKIYQGTTSLEKRALMRADTGQSPLTEITRRTLEAGLGGGIGFATHHPILGTIPLLADTVPARTLGASALFSGGNVLPSATGALTRLFPLITTARGIQRINEIKPHEKNQK